MTDRLDEINAKLAQPRLPVFDRGEVYWLVTEVARLRDMVTRAVDRRSSEAGRAEILEAEVTQLQDVLESAKGELRRVTELWMAERQEKLVAQQALEALPPSGAAVLTEELEELRAMRCETCRYRAVVDMGYAQWYACKLQDTEIVDGFIGCWSWLARESA